MKEVMHKLIMTFCLTFFTCSVFSQSIKFAYDENGNRVSRITISKDAPDRPPDTLRFIQSKSQMIQPHGNVTISIFPNPTSDIINIQCKEIDNPIDLDLNLFSSKGELLKTLKINNLNQTMDVGGYPNGIYHLKINVGNRTESWKIIKR